MTSASLATISWNAAHLLMLAVAGLLAGALNAAAGGGSLLTFPVLVALGMPALTANLSNTVAQGPGNVVIAHAYRTDFRRQRERIVRLVPPALIGGGFGIAILELGSYSVFRAVVPALVLLACFLLLAQNRIRKRLQEMDNQRRSTLGLQVTVALASAYCAYFGAATGVLLLGVLGSFLSDDLQRLNALSRLLVLSVNGLAAVVFIIIGPLDWTSIAVLAPATMLGGRSGAGLVRRLDARQLRACVLAIGAAASIYLICTSW
jgi:uncharacterized protein